MAIKKTGKSLTKIFLNYGIYILLLAVCVILSLTAVLRVLRASATVMWTRPRHSPSSS